MSCLESLNDIENQLFTVSESIKNQVLEMAKIKCQFDAEKFTVGKQGPFVASQFHFLMRQYRFALSEAPSSPPPKKQAVEKGVPANVRLPTVKSPRSAAFPVVVVIFI